MQPALERPATLAVGAPGRLVMGRAVYGSLGLALLFLTFTWTTKETRVLYVHTPWQNDPYDTAVSFAILFVPLVVGLCLLRLPLCRRAEVLPVRRATDLLRACRVLVGAVIITISGDWASVALRADRGTWTRTTTVLVGLLAVLTALAGAVGRQLWLARRAVPEQPDAGSVPDWLSDVVALGEREAGRLGSRGDQAVDLLRWLDVRLLARVRSHPLGAAGLLSLVLGAAIASSQALAEGAGPVALVLFGASACGLFALFVSAGAYLRLVGARSEASRAVTALVLACASVPLALAFRGVLWPLLGVCERDAGLTQLATLLLVVATATGGLTWVVAALLKRRRPRPR